jgi:integrase/recombinase XerC
MLANTITVIEMERFSPKSSDRVVTPLAIAKYVHWCATGHTSTARAKRNDLATLVEFLGTSAVLADLTRSALDNFLEARLSVESPATVSRRLWTIKHFCAYVAQHFPFENPAPEVRAPRMSKSKPKWLTRDEVSRLRAVRMSERDRVVVELGLCAGLRDFEIRLLDGSHVQANFLVNFRRKGRRFSTKIMAAPLRSAIAAWAPLRNSVLNAWAPRGKQIDLAEYPLVLSTRGAISGAPESFRVGVKTIYRLIKRLGELAQIEHMHPHRLRHTFCREIYLRTRDPIVTRDCADHVSVTTTERYTVPDQNEIDQAILNMTDTEDAK